MTISPPCPYTLSLGALVIGALPGPERRELQDHLHDCERCQDELVSLAALPGLLRRLSCPPRTSLP